MSEDEQDFGRYNSGGRILDLKGDSSQSREKRIEDINSFRRESLCFLFLCFGTEEAHLFEIFIYYSLMLDGRRKRREKHMHLYEKSSFRTNALFFILLYLLSFYKCTPKFSTRCSLCYS